MSNPYENKCWYNKYRTKYIRVSPALRCLYVIWSIHNNSQQLLFVDRHTAASTAVSRMSLLCTNATSHHYSIYLILPMMLVICENAVNVSILLFVYSATFIHSPWSTYPSIKYLLFCHSYGSYTTYILYEKII